MDRANQQALDGTSPDLPPAGWDRGPGPLHRRLADAIEGLVVRGELAPGARLPTERELARRAAVSRATAAEAYRRLKAAGRVRGRQGSGTWVAGPPSPAGRVGAGGVAAEGIAPVLAHVDEPIDLALAAQAPSGALREELGELLAAASTAVVGVGYEPAGLPALRTALGEGRPEEVIVTSGAQQALSLVMEELVRPGDVVVVEDVTYVGALDAARRVGARLVSVPTGDEGVDVDALTEVVVRHRPAVVYLDPTHHSPTGSVLPDAARARILEVAARSRVPVIDDRVLADLAFDRGRRPRPLRSFDLVAPVVTVGSLSKSVWAGLRVGWVRADPALVARLVQRRMVVDLGGDLIAQQVALALVDRLPLLARVRAEELAAGHARLRDALSRHLTDWEVAPALGGTAVWARLPLPVAGALAAAAAERGVYVVAGPVLSPHGGMEDHLRLSVTQPAAVLDVAVDRLAEAWAHVMEVEGPRRRQLAGSTSAVARSRRAR